MRHGTGDDDGEPGPGVRAAAADVGHHGPVAEVPSTGATPNGGASHGHGRDDGPGPSRNGRDGGGRDGADLDGEPAGGEGSRSGRLIRSLVEWVVVIVGALAVAMVLRAVLFQAYWIPSESMEPTLQRDDRVLVNRLSYQVGDVGRGDVVVFARPPGQPETGIKDLIKRVIALEGETVEGRDGRVVVDGEPLDEGYLADGPPIGDFGPVEVPPGHVFVMGDNRHNSVDSRVFGPIDDDSIIGRAFVLFWPIDRLRWL